MNPLIRSIYESRKVVGRSGKEIALHSEIDSAEGAFIHKVISDDPSVNRTLEIGCAYGLSSLHICDALSSRPEAHHTILDPFQMTNWDGVGVGNLEKAGVRFFQLIEQRSEFAMPELLKAGEARFDFIFVDGWHTFDHTLLDCFYATRLLRKGGYLLVDDADMPPVGRAIDYLTAYPCYRIHSELTRPLPSTVKRQAARFILNLIPPSVRRRVFHPVFVATAFQTQARRMLAFQKIAEDQRGWDWFPDGF